MCDLFMWRGGSTSRRQAQSRLTHQGLDGMEQEGKRWKGEQSRALPIKLRHS